jgi:hypothetical protein
MTALFKTRKEKEEENDEDDDEKRNESIKIRTKIRRSAKIATADRVASII